MDGVYDTRTRLRVPVVREHAAKFCALATTPTQKAVHDPDDLGPCD